MKIGISNEVNQPSPMKKIKNEQFQKEINFYFIIRTVLYNCCPWTVIITNHLNRYSANSHTALNKKLERKIECCSQLDGFFFLSLFIKNHGTYQNRVYKY